MFLYSSLWFPEGFPLVLCLHMRGHLVGSSRGRHSKTTCVGLVTGEDAARLLQRHSATAAAAEIVSKCRNLSSSGPGARHNRLVFVMEGAIGAIERKGASGALWEGAKESRAVVFQS